MKCSRMPHPALAQPLRGTEPHLTGRLGWRCGLRWADHWASGGSSSLEVKMMNTRCQKWSFGIKQMIQYIHNILIWIIRWYMIHGNVWLLHMWNDVSCGKLDLQVKQQHSLHDLGADDHRKIIRVHVAPIWRVPPLGKLVWQWKNTRNVQHSTQTFSCRYWNFPRPHVCVHRFTLR